jgi:hypothetical protein
MRLLERLPIKGAATRGGAVGLWRTTWQKGQERDSSTGALFRSAVPMLLDDAGRARDAVS